MAILGICFGVGLLGCDCDGPATSTGAGGGGAGGDAAGGGGAGGGGAGGGASCVSCSAAITPGGNPEKLPVCAASTALFNSFNDCSCLGACADFCLDSVCAAASPTTACSSCQTDTSANGGGTEFNECANDK